MVWQQHQKCDLRVLLFCCLYGDCGQTIKFSVMSNNEFSHPVFYNMGFNSLKQSRQKFLGCLAVSNEKATLTFH